MSNTFFVYLPSNSTDYPDNAPNRFRVRLPKPLYFTGGTWVCGLHSIAFAYSWPLLGTIEDQSINIHFAVDGGAKQKIVHIPVPKAAHTRVEQLREFLAATLSHQSASIQDAGKSDYQFVEAPPLQKRARRAAAAVTDEAELPSPPSTDEDDEDKLRSPSPFEHDEEPKRKAAKLLSEILYANLIADSLPKKDLVDELFGKKDEKSRAEKLLTDIGLGKAKEATTQPPPAAASPKPAKPPAEQPKPKPPPQTAPTPTATAPTPSSTTSTIDLIVGKKGETTRAEKVLTDIGLGKAKAPQTPPPPPSAPPTPAPSAPPKPVQPAPAAAPTLPPTAPSKPTPSAQPVVPSTTLDVLIGKKKEKNRAQKFLSVLLGDDDADDDGPTLERIRQLVDAVEFQYHKEFERFKAVFKHQHIEFLSLSSQLGYMLGFENPHRVLNNEVAKYSPDLRGGMSSFAVYTKGLTENMIIGNTLSSLLRVVSVAGAVPGEYTEKIYESPIYVRVLPKEVSEIEIELRTMDSGRLVPFSYGTTMLVLVFKKVINF